QSATDPKTGMIDMDTFITGMSSSMRQEIAKQAATLSTVVDQLPSSTIRGVHLLRKFNEALPADAENLQWNEFKRVVDFLADQGNIRIRERRLGDNCEIRRLG
ncbi:hypothetical protein BVRB_041140, partial [Beta vulgaris subsp. vulgaris]